MKRKFQERNKPEQRTGQQKSTCLHLSTPSDDYINKSELFRDENRTGTTELTKRTVLP